MLERTLKRSISDEQRKSLHFALGKLHDEAREYEQAFAHWRSANDMEKKKFDLKKNARRFDDLKTVFTEEKCERRLRARNNSALPVFIVGMPRSGTSLVEQILSSHPEVYGAGELRDIGNLINMLPASVARKKGAEPLNNTETIGWTIKNSARKITLWERRPRRDL